MFVIVNAIEVESKRQRAKVGKDQRFINQFNNGSELEDRAPMIANENLIALPDKDDFDGKDLEGETTGYLYQIKSYHGSFFYSYKRANKGKGKILRLKSEWSESYHIDRIIQEHKFHKTGEFIYHTTLHTLDGYRSQYIKQHLMVDFLDELVVFMEENKGTTATTEEMFERIQNHFSKYLLEGCCIGEFGDSFFFAHTYKHNRFQELLKSAK